MVCVKFVDKDGYKPVTIYSMGEEVGWCVGIGGWGDLHEGRVGEEEREQWDGRWCLCEI